MNSDTLYEIFKHILLTDVFNCMLVCRDFNDVFNKNPFIWKDYLTDIINDECIILIWVNNWKNTYRKYIELCYLKKRFQLSRFIF